ncbi:MAG: 16S rRNA (cytidine(1402)-2'-O)-methyltransferase [Lachnospiraceae bacterium]|nr:16S rRNA (cytidine(1402)-2'-O)-methyltransferase [Lachnospiraceae bacterium]
MSGTLYLCATPIGNLEDITLRVLRVLKEADLIACEDTRHSRVLLSHYDIHTPVTSYHQHNRVQKAGELIEKLASGLNIALITDAGTPIISDPGDVLVQRCYENGIRVTSVPGPCAGITALTLSGIDSGRFAFYGFLPVKGRERKELLADLKSEKMPVELYEAPHKLKKTLADLYAVLGDRSIVILRELTKVHEERMKCSLSEAVSYYDTTEPKGEFVLIIEPAPEEEIRREEDSVFAEIPLIGQLQEYMAAGMDKKSAMKQIAKERHMSRRDVYQAVLEAEAEE